MQPAKGSDPFFHGLLTLRQERESTMARSKHPAPGSADAKLAKAFAIYRRYAYRLRKRKGVVAVGFGLKSTQGCYGFEYLPHLPKPSREQVTYALRVYVREKVHARSLPRKQLLPTHIEGVPVDVIEMPRGRCTAGIGFAVDFNPLIGGAPVGIAREFGTLGIVAASMADGQPRLLTCAHVAFGVPPTANPGPFFQPPQGSPVAVGKPETNGLDFQIPLDCATVALNGAKPGTPGQIFSMPGPVNGILPRDPSLLKIQVMKYGVKTDLTRGRIVDAFFFFFNEDLQIGFDNQYLIASTNAAAPFVDAGDSGALVVAQQGGGLAAVGIVIGQTDNRHAVALPIADALDGLGLQL
jgi:hypothetical protein